MPNLPIHRIPSTDAFTAAWLCLALCVTSGAIAAQEGPSSRESSAPLAATFDPAQHLAQARQTLMSTRSLEAKIEQQGRLASGNFSASGTYLAGTFPHIRLEMTTELGHLTGQLLEICDGQVLWTSRKVTGLPIDPDDEDSTGTETLVSRRDIDLIRDALEESRQTPKQILAAELGVGGLPTLLAGLQSSFDFTGQRNDEGQIVLTGRWKPEEWQRLRLLKHPRVPTGVEIVFEPHSPVPVELTYFRDDEGRRVPQMITRFSDVLVGHAIDMNSFRYTPPTGVDVVNRTPDVVATVRDEPVE